jgi:hypothetical protein
MQAPVCLAQIENRKDTPSALNVNWRGHCECRETSRSHRSAMSRIISAARGFAENVAQSVRARRCQRERRLSRANYAVGGKIVCQGIERARGLCDLLALIMQVGFFVGHFDSPFD